MDQLGTEKTVTGKATCNGKVEEENVCFHPSKTFPGGTNS